MEKKLSVFDCDTKRALKRVKRNNQREERVSKGQRQKGEREMLKGVGSESVAKHDTNTRNPPPHPRHHPHHPPQRLLIAVITRFSRQPLPSQGKLRYPMQIESPR